MKLLMRDEAKGKEHTIFVTIFAALMVMLVIMVMLMASAIGVSGVTLRLDENAVDILDKQVENRARYIETQLQQAQDLTGLSSFINDTARQMLDEGTISLDTLDSTGGESLPLLEAAAPRLLKALRAKQVSGVFLILNTHDFTGRTSGDRLPCVYLRDLDPEAAPSADNSDVMFERAPAELRTRRGRLRSSIWMGKRMPFMSGPSKLPMRAGSRPELRRIMAAGRPCPIRYWAMTGRPSPTRSL